MWLRIAEQTRRMIFYAQEEAIAHGRTDVASEHLLLGLLHEVMAQKSTPESVWPPAPTGCINPLNIVALVLHEVGVDLEKLQVEAQRQVTLLHLPTGKEFKKMQLTQSAKRVIDIMYTEHRRLAVNEIRPEFLLLALIRDEIGMAGQVLTQSGLDLEIVRQIIGAIHQPLKDKATRPSLWSQLFARRPAT